MNLLPMLDLDGWFNLLGLREGKAMLSRDKNEHEMRRKEKKKRRNRGDHRKAGSSRHLFSVDSTFFAISFYPLFSPLHDAAARHDQSYLYLSRDGHSPFSSLFSSCYMLLRLYCLSRVTGRCNG